MSHKYTAKLGKVYHRDYFRKNRERLNAYQRAHYAERAPRYKEKKRETSKLLRVKRRDIVLKHYSNGELKCACCGEDEYLFLTIDHINGCSPEERKIQGLGTSLYRWIIKNNFPDGFQVLCYNCNCAKGFYGSCPHNKHDEDRLKVEIRKTT